MRVDSSGGQPQRPSGGQAQRPPSSPPAATIRITARPGPSLEPGQVVTLSVLKRLGPGAWAVGIEGKVFRARSALELAPGQSVSARVSGQAGRIVLTVVSEALDRFEEALRAQGIELSAETRPIVAALVRGGQPIDRRTVERLRALIARTRLDPGRGARLAATLMDKGLDPAGPGAAEILQLASLGERGGKDHRRYRGRPLPGDAQALKRSISEALASASPESGLQVCNSLAGRSETWVVVPFLYRSEGSDYPGTIKCLVDPWAARLRALVVSVAGERAGRWHFRFDLEGRRRLGIWCDDPAAARRSRILLDTFRAKVHNMQLEVDDTISDGSAFDGFSTPEAPR